MVGSAMVACWVLAAGCVVAAGVWSRSAVVRRGGEALGWRWRTVAVTGVAFGCARAVLVVRTGL
jgi:hypothetical protein